MFSAIKLELLNSSPSAPPLPQLQRRPSPTRFHISATFNDTNTNRCCFASLALQYHVSATPPTASPPSILTSSVGSPQLGSHFAPQWNLTHRHVFILSSLACAVAISASWLFFSAIPTLLAFRKASESLEKLMDAATEELPDTMAAIRLSGMEISDLTMELSDLGQEITRGVRNSTQVVRVAEERLRRLTTMAPTVLKQERGSPDAEPGGAAVARAARGVKEGIVKGREILQIFLSLSHFSRLALNFFIPRGKKL
ncbi:hypothetical protein Scep_001760 [Stephania cephalantha]|uniref:Transmembrane protein n=1 Tax=Stephania cephalantha TaxID=152367 RepID=A0AAP0Q5C7_9MAGN